MRDVSQLFLQTMEQEQLWPLLEKGSVLALSGGVDSMVLAHLMHTHKLPFVVAHLDFQLQPTSSVAWELVEKATRGWQVPFFGKKVDTTGYATSHKCSLQVAARDLRYQFFEQLRLQQQKAVVVTAHHAQDQIETIGLQWLRGAGLAGLKGMLLYNSASHLLRPLLWASKEELYAYAHKKKLSFWEDPSNKRSTYRRNYFRQAVWPHFKQINPNLLQTTYPHILKLQESHAFLEEQLAVEKEKICDWGADINRIKLSLLKKKRWGGLLLYQLLGPFGYSYQMLRRWFKKHRTQPEIGARAYSATHFLEVVSDDHWVFGPKAWFNKSTPTDHTLSSKHLPYALKSGWGHSLALTHTATGLAWRLCAQDSASTYQPWESIHTYFRERKNSLPPFADAQLRAWKPGDKMRIYQGKKQHKKIADILNSCGVPRYLKHQAQVVVVSGEIKTLLGFRQAPEIT